MILFDMTKAESDILEPSQAEKMVAREDNIIPVPY